MKNTMAILLLLLSGGCSGLLPKAVPVPAFHSLDGPIAPASSAAAPQVLASAPVLIVNPTRAAPGFDSKHMMYQREAHKLEYFAHHEWVDTPSRMLAPLLLAAIERTGAFRAVVQTPTAAIGDVTLDTQIEQFKQDFLVHPSQVRFALRIALIANPSRQILAWRVFAADVATSSEDPDGGVRAANTAVNSVLEEVAVFCGSVISQPKAANSP